MKAFKVYWLESIAPSGEKYLGDAVILAPDVTKALEIAETYGPVKAIHLEATTVIVEPKAA